MPILHLELSESEVAALYLAAAGRTPHPVMADAAALARDWVVQHLGRPCEGCGIPRQVHLEATYQENGQWVSAYQMNERALRCSNTGCSEYGSILLEDANGDTRVLQQSRDAVPRRPVRDTPQA